MALSKFAQNDRMDSELLIKEEYARHRMHRKIDQFYAVGNRKCRARKLCRANT